MIIINSILVFVFFLAWHENDVITHQSQYSLFPNWKWYVENRWRTKSWWLKNVFTFALDGMHFTSSTYRIIGYIFFAQLVVEGFLWVALVAVALYILTGALHSLLNRTLL